MAQCCIIFCTNDIRLKNGISWNLENNVTLTISCMIQSRGVVTALKPVRAEQVRRPQRKQNWTVPHCGSVLPICLSLRPVGSIHISCLSAWEQTSAAQIAKASPPYNMKYFNSFLALSFNSIFNYFWLKRPSTSARTVVPLTTPLIQRGDSSGLLLNDYLIFISLNK